MDEYPVFLKTDQGLINALQLFRGHLQPQEDTDDWIISFPFCHADVSPSVVFRHSRIDYFDQLKKTVLTLSNYCYIAHISDSRGPHKNMSEDGKNLLLLLNPDLSKEEQREIAQIVRCGGFILCDNYRGTASNLEENLDFMLFAGILVNRHHPDRCEYRKSIGEENTFNALRELAIDVNQFLYFIFQRIAPDDESSKSTIKEVKE